jgi:hypothetical protein
VTALGHAADAAPDFAEAIEAWRVWSVVEVPQGYRLGSVIKPTLWSPDEPLVAKCLRGWPSLRWFRRRHAKEHTAPEDRCECGIYGAGLRSIGPYLRDPPANRAVARVLGQVSLWGTVVECERGFRASCAYPLRLFVPTDAALQRDRAQEELAAGIEVYGVPVELLRVRCSDAPDVLERRPVARQRG